LVLSPLIAALLTALVYRVAIWPQAGWAKDACVCVGAEPAGTSLQAESPVAVQAVESQRLTAVVDAQEACARRYWLRVTQLNVAGALDALHFLSAGVVSFARGLNDTPKIAALLVVAGSVSRPSGCMVVAMAMAVGGLVAARRVGETMSHRITPMNHREGLIANLATGALVLAASVLGLPASTTHVSCGSLIGLGAASHHARWAMIGRIVAAWLWTLPAAAFAAALWCAALSFVSMSFGPH
jgi:PiT family inorganic phosphate transporter